MAPSRTRVSVIVDSYPQSSQTYISTEAQALEEQFEVQILFGHRADLARRSCPPALGPLSSEREMRAAIDAFEPHVLHTHWTHMVPRVHRLARATGIPYTVRTHSFDTLSTTLAAPGASVLSDLKRRLLGFGVTKRRGEGNRHRFPWELLEIARHPARARLPWVMLETAPLLNDPLCLGVVALPFSRTNLELAGVRPEKIFDCRPVVDFERFHDLSQNGSAVMNVGAALPKKRMQDFIELARRMPERTFNLYPLGYRVEELRQLNARYGNPANILPMIAPEDMPAEYKKHEYLFYTFSWWEPRVGWPISVAEAQASGVGVLMANVRPDVAEFVGDAGYVFDSLGEAEQILRKPFPEEKRRAGFEQARKSDIRSHLPLLTDLWKKAIPRAESSRRSLRA